MKPIVVRGHTEADGMLSLRVPTGVPEQDVEAVVVVSPICQSGGGAGWPPGFFERTAGMWQGVPLVREDQGEYERREKLR